MLYTFQVESCKEVKKVEIAFAKTSLLTPESRNCAGLAPDLFVYFSLSLLFLPSYSQPYFSSATVICALPSVATYRFSPKVNPFSSVR